jgi:ABC-type transport system involved in cytochrome c biogenesis ATPase subunit
MEYLYSIAGLSFAYEKGQPVFGGLDLDIPSHGLTLINGGNGTGKTTLCRLLTGLTKGYTGSLRLNNEEMKRLDRSKILENVIYIKQDLTGNLMGITPDEDLKIWQNRFSEPDTAGKAEKRKLALQLLGAEKVGDTPVWELSYGQKRRTMLSVLPLFREKYWIIDEPTASLDEEGITLLIKLLKKKTENHCGALILTHRKELFRELFPVLEASEQQRTKEKRQGNNSPFLLSEGRVRIMEW